MTASERIREARKEREKMPDLAGEAYDWFETAKRGEGDDAETFDRLKDGAPEWLKELVYEAHGDYLPDDWRYACIRSALGFVHDNDADEDDVGEFADGVVDVYTAARFAWLSSNLNRQGYVDEAMSEFGPTESIVDAVGLGQYLEAQEVYASVVQSLHAKLREMDENDQD